MGERKKEGHQGRKIREWEEEEKCVLIKAAEEEKWVEDKAEEGGEYRNRSHSFIISVSDERAER